MPKTLPSLAFAALTFLALGMAHADPYAGDADAKGYEDPAPEMRRRETAEREPCTVRAIVERRPGCGGRIHPAGFANGSSRTLELKPCDVGRCREVHPAITGPSGYARIEIR